MNRKLSSEITEIVRDACLENADSLASSRRALLGSGYLTYFAQSITAGAFFNTFLLLMGADDVTIGYATMITTFCSIFQFFAPLFWERLPKRKSILIPLFFLRDFLTYGVMTILPILPISNPEKLVCYFLLTLISAVINNFCLPAQNAWSMQSVPLCKRVNYTSISSLFSTVINVISVFLGGVLLDAYRGKPVTDSLFTPTMQAIFILRSLALLATVFSTLLLAFRVPEMPYEPNFERSTSGRKVRLSVLLLPLKNRKFLGSVLVPCLWTMISSIIGSFFSLHLVENVQMSYTKISLANFIATPLILLMTPVWTLVLDRHSWIRSLSWAFLGYSAAYASNVFISRDTQYFYFIAVILGQLFMPCITMVNNNMIYLHLPKDKRTAYFGFYTLLSGISSFLGQTIGTLFVGATSDLRLELFGVSICNLQLTSAIASVCTVLLALYVARLAKSFGDIESIVRNSGNTD